MKRVFEATRTERCDKPRWHRRLWDSSKRIASKVACYTILPAVICLSCMPRAVGEQVGGPDAAVQTNRIERESEQQMSPNRTVFGKGDGVYELAYKGYEIDVQNFATGPDSEGLWTGNLVDIEVQGASGFNTAGVLRSMFEQDVLELPEGISVTAGYSMNNSGNWDLASAEIAIHDDNPQMAHIREVVDQTVYVDDPSEVVSERIQSLEVSFPNGIWSYRVELGEAILVDKSESPNIIDLGMFGKGFITTINGHSEYLAVGLGEVCTQDLKLEGTVSTFGDMTITVEELSVYVEGDSIRASIDIEGGFDVNHYFTTMWHFGTDWLFVMAATAWDADTGGLFIRSCEIKERFIDGDIIERDGSNWSVSITVNEGNDVSSVSFTRLD